MQAAAAFGLAFWAFFSGVAMAQEERPDGPPWTETCAPLDQGSLSEIFTAAQCQTDFLAEFETHSVPDIHVWMADHKSCFREWAHFSWLAFSRRDMKMATLAWEHQLMLVNDRLGEGVDALLARGETGEIGDEARAFTNGFLDEVEKNQSYKPSMDKAYAAVRSICLYHASIECVGAMTKVLDWMYPRSYSIPGPPKESLTYSMIPFYREAFGDATMQRYASRLARQLIAKIQAGVDPRASDETLYTMGLAAFEGDVDRFFKFMVIYATRGAAWATGYKMAHPDNKPLFAASMVISAAMGYLDIAYSQVGLAWSYAPATTSTCYQPKPYHYWMAAGYAYLLRKEGYSERASVLVARLLGALYELGSTTQGRHPEDVFFVPTYDPRVNRERRELTHHFEGAQFGVNYRHPPEENSFDNTLLRFYKHSSALPDVSDDEMRERIKDQLTEWRYWTDLVGYYVDRPL